MRKGSLVQVIYLGSLSSQSGPKHIYCFPFLQGLGHLFINFPKNKLIASAKSFNCPVSLNSRVEVIIVLSQHHSHSVIDNSYDSA